MSGESWDEALRQAWWPALSAAMAITGELTSAEDAVQEASAVAVLRWPKQLPANPSGWLAVTARHKALDVVRREALRPIKETAAARDVVHDSLLTGGRADIDPGGMLALLFLSAHPAFDVATRTALTLRAVCGLSAREIAAVMLQPPATVAKRLVRARRKIRDSGIRFVIPDVTELSARLDDVLRSLSLLYSHGYRHATGQDPRPASTRRAIDVTKHLAQLLPAEPEVLALTAFMLFTDARADARFDDNHAPVLLAEQDRSRYDVTQISSGNRLLERALRIGTLGPWQLQAAIAGCHSGAADAADTDWREIAALYGELLRYDPSPVHLANRAIALAEAEGPVAGLVVLDSLLHHPNLATWASIHIARATLLHRAGRPDDARQAYLLARSLDPSDAELRFIDQRIQDPHPPSHSKSAPWARYE